MSFHLNTRKLHGKNKKKANETQVKNYKLSEWMTSEIRDSFNFQDSKRCGSISKKELKNILGGFFSAKVSAKELEDNIISTCGNKDCFSLEDVLEIFKKKWFYGKGREDEGENMFQIFARKDKGSIGFTEIKQVFGQYLDTTICDTDILEFVEGVGKVESDHIDRKDFLIKLGYREEDAK